MTNPTRSVVVTDQGSFANRSEAADAAGLTRTPPPGMVSRTPSGMATTVDPHAPGAKTPLGDAGNAPVRLYDRPGVRGSQVQVADLTHLGLGEVEVGQVVAAGLLTRAPDGQLSIGPAAMARGTKQAAQDQTAAERKQAEAVQTAAYHEATRAVEGALADAGLSIQDEVQSYFASGQVSPNAIQALTRHLGGHDQVTAVIETIEKHVVDYVTGEGHAVAPSMNLGGLDHETAAGLVTLMESQPEWPGAVMELLQSRPRAIGQLIRKCLDGSAG